MSGSLLILIALILAAIALGLDDYFDDKHDNSL